MRESTVYDLFETVVLAEITELNGNITEGGLNMMIMKEIVSDRTHEKELECGKNMVSCIMDSEEDSEKEVKNGAYVYNAYNKEGLLFNGISIRQVQPAATAALDPVSKSSRYSNPGSFKCA